MYNQTGDKKMNEIKNYIESLELGGKSPLTVKAYEKDINKMVSYFKITSLSELDNLSVNDFFEFYKSTGLKENSLNSLIRNLYAFMNAMKIVGNVSENNAFFKVRFGGKKYVKVNTKIKPVLTSDEAEKIIMAGSSTQERFMLSLMLKTALRRSEIINIKLTDIDGCQIKIKGKGGNEFVFPLNKILCSMLEEYLNERKDKSEYLFYPIRGEMSEGGKLTGTSVNNRVMACAKRAGIDKKITAHRLRATAITNAAVTHGKSVAQGLARHKSGATTEIYINTQESVRDLLLED